MTERRGNKTEHRRAIAGPVRAAAAEGDIETAMASGREKQNENENETNQMRLSQKQMQLKERQMGREKTVPLACRVMKTESKQPVQKNK